MKHNFRKLKIWQEAIEIVVDAYEIVKKLPREEIYGLTAQMRKAANSISSQIAEGSGRRTEKDFSNFVDIALGSSNELISDLIVCRQLNYLSQSIVEPLISRIESWQSTTFNFQQKQLKQSPES